MRHNLYHKLNLNRRTIKEYAYDNSESFEVQQKADDFYLAAKDSGLFTQLKYCGFRKTRGFSVAAVVFSLLTRVFCFSNLYWRMRSAWGRSVLNCGKDVFYDALTSGHFNWTKLCTGVAAAFVRKLRLNKDSRACFIIDDTIIGRPRSKKAELLARTYDHVFHRTTKGFTQLLLSWTDGRSTIPAAFSMLSSPGEKNRIMPAVKTDGRTQGALRRREAVMHKPEMVITLLQRALNEGIKADYVLMDTWFTAGPLLLAIRKPDLHVAGMVRQLKQRYFTGKTAHTLPPLLKMVRGRTAKGSGIAGSVCAKTKSGPEVKIVFIVNRNKRSEFLSILSTGVSLSDEETVRLYARRFSIEASFYNMKHFFRLVKENQGRSFDSTVACSALCVLRLLIPEWIERGSSDTATIGGLFHKVREDQLPVPLESAVSRLMKLFISLPGLLIEKRLMSPEHRWQAMELIHEMLNSAFNSTGGFISAFITSCRAKAAEPPAPGTLTGTGNSSCF